MKVLDSFLFNEIFVRVFILVIYLIIGSLNPFERKIHPEEIWMYRYPITKSICPVKYLWSIILVISTITILSNYIIKNDKKDFMAAILTFSLSIVTTATITRMLKFGTGFPRPDFYWRCYPDSNITRGNTMVCYGDILRIKDGRQSFPSGHTSLAFAGLGFISLYLLGKLKIYHLKGKGQSWRFLTCLLPLIISSLIGISRICDYHHHPIDVFVGSILGSVAAFLCYHHYYPPFYAPNCDLPLPYSKTTELL